LGYDGDRSLPPLDMIIRAREGFASTIFREIVIISTWAICTRKESDARSLSGGGVNQAS
jgi:hypothetical protein